VNPNRNRSDNARAAYPAPGQARTKDLFGRPASDFFGGACYMRLSQSLGKQVLLLALLVPCDMQVAVIGKDCNRPKVITSRFVLRKSSKIKRVERLQAASAPPRRM
jgi:hypothetical protein